MAQSVVMVYESLEAIKNGREYWKDYVDHYEKFWDGPATPQSAWFGHEYEEFRTSLAERLGIGVEHIRNAFFLKNEDGKYFVCPVGDSVNLNIMACEDIIPYEWFLMFSSEEKDYFYTHTGFGAIHQDAIYYRTERSSALVRLERCTGILKNTIHGSNDTGSYPYLAGLSYLTQGIENVSQWIEGFSDEAVLILNYGEICNLIDQNSFKYEDSVGEINSVINSIEKGDFTTAESNLKLLNSKWTEISDKSGSSLSNSTLQ